MAKYVKKPVIVEAVPYEFGLEDGFIRYNEYVNALDNSYPASLRSTKYPRYPLIHEQYIDEALLDPTTDWRPYIHTLEGMHVMDNSDMIITGVNGERYPCKLDIFNLTYDAVV